MKATCRTVLLAVLASIVLAACSSDKEVFVCPRAYRVLDAARQVKFEGAGRDLTDVLYEFDLRQVGLSCEYDDNVVEAVLGISFVATRGPADRARVAPLKYFVAIATLDRRIVAREEFELSVPFQGNHTRISVTEELEPRIPLNPGESGGDYQVFVGISLSPEEIRYNRQNR